MSHPVESFYKELPPGWFTRMEAITLFNQVTATRGDVLEIGTYCGRSATVILEALKGTGRRLWCVDLPPDEHYCEPPGGRPDVASYVRALKETWGPAVVYFQGDLNAFRAAHANLRFGFAFIDGNHDYTYVLSDIRNCLEIVTGSIALHDYEGNGCPGVKAAADAAGLKIDGVVDSMAVSVRRPFVTFLTPVSRPQNLKLVGDSIARVMDPSGIPYEWVLSYDLRHTRPGVCNGGPDAIHPARAFSCSYTGQAGNCCRNVALPHVAGEWVHHLDDDTIVHENMPLVLREAMGLEPEIKLYRFHTMIGEDRGTNYDTGSWIVRTPAPLWNPDEWGGDKLYVDAIPVDQQEWSELPGAHYNYLRR